MSEKSPGEMLDAMLALDLFVVTSSPARGPGIKEKLAEHLDYQVALEREGILFGAGPLTKPGEDAPYAGMIILRAKDFAHAAEIADQDPFHVAGLRTYTISSWKLNEGSINVSIRYSDQSVIVK